MPYAGMSNQKVWISVADGYRLSQPDQCSGLSRGAIAIAMHHVLTQYHAVDKYKLMLSCWATSTKDRPSFQGIVAAFGEVEALTPARKVTRRVQPPPQEATNPNAYDLSNDMPSRQATLRDAPPSLAKLASSGSDFGTGATTYLALAGEEHTIYAEDEFAPGALSPSSVASGSIGNPMSPEAVLMPEYELATPTGFSQPINKSKGGINRPPHLKAIAEHDTPEYSTASSYVSLNAAEEDADLLQTAKGAQQQKMPLESSALPPLYSQVFSPTSVTRASSAHSSVAMMQADLHDVLDGNTRTNPLYSSRATSFRSTMKSPSRGLNHQLSKASVLTSDL
jgi:hypothetical protein